MEYLRTRADRFWKDGRLRREEMEEIIVELKRAEEEKGNKDVESCCRKRGNYRRSVATTRHPAQQKAGWNLPTAMQKSKRS